MPDSPMEETTTVNRHAPKVFVSYSHDSPEHKAWVLTLAEDLRKLGIDAILDQWDLAAGQDIPAFMGTGISSSDRVILEVPTKEFRWYEAWRRKGEELKARQQGKRQ